MTRRGLSLLQKGLLIISIPLVFQLALLVLLFNQQRRQTYAQEMAVHTKEVIVVVDRILESLLVMQADLRGEMLQLPATIEPGGEAEHTLPDQLQELSALVSDNPEQVATSANLATLIESRLRWSAEIHGMLRDGRNAQAIAESQKGEGASLMRQIRDEIGTIRVREEALDRARLAALAETTRRFQFVLIAGLILDVAMAAVAIYLLTQSVGRRVRLLTENVNRIKAGDPLLPATSVPDEVGELDRSFHAMAAALAEAQRKERDFQRTIEGHNAELTRANHELKQKNQENEMFVYSVSHDLRSPLVNLQGFSNELGIVRNALTELFAQPLDEAARGRGLRMIERDISEPITYIQNAVTRLSSIIDALLRLSRAGRVEYQPVTVDLDLVIRRIVGALRGSIASRRADVRVQAMTPTWGDPTAIEQIFANLLVNAVNYLDSARPGVIDVGVEKQDDAGTTYFVRDNGLGIAAAHLPKLFSVFQRLHEKVAPGEGVGLALVRRAAERHGGRIWAESEEGVGTTFYVYFPHESASPLQAALKKERLTATSPLPAELVGAAAAE